MTAKQIYNHKWNEGDLAFIIIENYSPDLGIYGPEKPKTARVVKVVKKDEDIRLGYPERLCITFYYENKNINIVLEKYNAVVISLTPENKIYLSDIIAQREYKKRIENWNDKLTKKIEKLNKLFIKNEE